MGVYDYKNLGTEDSKALFSDALAITLYSYHTLDNGFSAGYQQYGLGLGLPATLVTALIGSSDSQGVIPGLPWNPDSEKAALEAVQKAGWTPIGASQLGYDGKTAIHPSHLETVNEVFAPTDAEIATAERIISALDAAPGRGAIALDGQMIDQVHLAAARKMLTQVQPKSQ